METKKILWVEDDYFHIQALFRKFEKEGYVIDYALTALEGYQKITKNPKGYAAIVVDLILPMKSPNEKIPEAIDTWGREEYPGVHLVRWLTTEVIVQCPVFILSVVPDPIEKYGLNNLGIKEAIPKPGLGPTSLMEKMKKYLKD